MRLVRGKMKGKGRAMGHRTRTNGHWCEAQRTESSDQGGAVVERAR